MKKTLFAILLLTAIALSVTIVACSSEVKKADTTEETSNTAETTISANSNSVSATFEEEANEEANGGKSIHVATCSANMYVTKHQRFWARQVTGVDSNGNPKLGNWECLLDAKNGNHEFWIDSKYVEFGFEFDIVAGTDWPYSGVFWTAENGAANDIFIEWGGGCRAATIDITVNDKNVIHNERCRAHRSAFNGI